MNDSSRSRSKTALVVSVAVVLLYWAYFTVHQWTRIDVPTDVRQIALRVSVKAAILLVVVWLLLRTSGERVRDLGFDLGGPRNVLICAVLLPAGLFLVINAGVNSVLGALMGRGPSPVLQELFRDPRQFPYWVVAAVVGGGFAEELERAFALTRFERLFGRPGLVAGIALNAVVFGMGHLYQGPSSAVSAGLTGSILALIFLRRRRVLDAMIVHAVFDLLGIAAAYALYAPRG